MVKKESQFKWLSEQAKMADENSLNCKTY